MSAIITVPKSPRVPLLISIAYGVSASLSVVLASVSVVNISLRAADDPKSIPMIISVGVLSVVLGGTAFFLWRERSKRRNDRFEVTSDGLRCVNRGISTLVSWEDITNVAVFRAMVQGVECPSVCMKLRNGKTLRIAAPTGVAAQISLKTSQAVLDLANAVRTVTREARQERFKRQIEAGDVVRCDGLSVSQHGIRLGKRELPWNEVGRIGRSEVGVGRGRLLIFHKTISPDRPWGSVAEGRIRDADVALPFCMQQLRENGVADQRAYPGTVSANQSAGPLATRLVALSLIAFGTFVGSIGYLEYAKISRCSFQTTAILDPTYTVTKTTGRRGTHTSYNVKYTFQVDGETFRGSDSLSREPDDIETTVYFNPNNPEENLLEPSRFWIVGGIGFGVCMAAVGGFLMFTSFQKPQGEKPSSAASETG